MGRQFFVYILASRRNGTLYVGMTSDLIGRIWQHRNDEAPGFTARYGVHTLVYDEEQSDAASAIVRETKMKKWRRRDKIALIERDNPHWRDLYGQLLDG
jgi:putative endonuclease